MQYQDTTVIFALRFFVTFRSCESLYCNFFVSLTFGEPIDRALWQGDMKSGIAHLERVANLKEPGDPKNKEHYFEALLLLSRY